MAVQPQPQVAVLDPIAGNWRTEGRVLGSDLSIRGSDRYEWLAGGYFLIHYVDVFVGDQKVDAIEVIGEYDEGRAAFVARSFDNEGAVATMLVQVESFGVLTFTGGSDVAPAAKTDQAAPTDHVRSTLRVADDRQSMTALWERSRNGQEWTPWMDVRFSRQG
jgi:hypothetical protein